MTKPTFYIDYVFSNKQRIELLAILNAKGGSK